METSLTAIVIRNIKVSFIFKGLNILINFALISLSLKYLDKAHYGVWTTVGSIFAWLNILDFGLGNGMRTYLGKALVERDYEYAKKIVSTTYFVIAAFTFLFAIVYFLISSFISWSKILNISGIENLDSIINIVLILFLLRFVFSLLNSILTANHKTASIDIIQFFINALIIIVIYYLYLFVPENNFANLVLSFSVIPVIVYALFSIYYFTNNYKAISPSFRNFDFKQISSLSSLGFKYFYLQINAIILLTTDNLIITQILGPSSVTDYNIAYKYFSIITVIYSVVFAPYVMAYAEAFNRNDINWIRKNNKTLFKFWLAAIIVILFMIAVSNHVYSLWVGQEINIYLTGIMGLSVIVNMYNSLYLPLINGLGKLKVQLYLATFIFLFNIPLSILLAINFNLGSTGVMMATVICTLFQSAFNYIQFNKILERKECGIWTS